MKKFIKKFVALATAAVLVTPGVAFASTATEVLQDAARNSVNLTTFQTVGDVSGSVFVDGGLGMEPVVADLEMVFDVIIDFDMAENIFRMYLEAIGSASDVVNNHEETFNLGMFVENDVLLISIDGEWFNFSDPAITGEVPSFDDMELLFAMSADLSADIYALLPATFASEQVPGYYVVDVIINNDNVAEIITGLFEIVFGSGVLSDVLGFLGEDEFGGLTEAEIAIVLEELAVLEELLSEVDIEFEILYRSYIDTETRNWQRYSFDINFALALDMGFLGTIDVGMELFSNFEIITGSGLEWPDFDLNTIPAFPLF